LQYQVPQFRFEKNEKFYFKSSNPTKETKDKVRETFDFGLLPL
jgi:hypothetical protein